MPRYLINYSETLSGYYEVVADDKEHAEKILLNGMGTKYNPPEECTDTEVEVLKIVELDPEIESLTAKDFGDISEESFSRIKSFLKDRRTIIEDLLDYHFEKTEIDMFNWMYKDCKPWEVLHRSMPGGLVNTCHVKEGWFYWNI